MHKILIADDDIVERKIVTRAAQALGCATVESSNGRIALEVLRDNLDVSLLVTDMLMPEVDGRELIKLVRQDRRFTQLPIIIVSGIVTLSEIDDVLAFGASRFLPKPIDIVMLKEYMARLLGMTASSNASVAETAPAR